MTKTSHFKHMDAATFMKKWKPFLIEKLHINNPFTFCTTRSPSSKIISWYKYRSRSNLKGSKRYLGSTPFRDFCSQRMQAQADKFFFDEKSKKCLVDIAIPLENLKMAEDFICKEFNITKIPKINISNKADPSSHAATMAVEDYEQIIEDEMKKASKIYIESVARHELLLDFFLKQNQYSDLRSTALDFKHIFK